MNQTISQSFKVQNFGQDEMFFTTKEKYNPVISINNKNEKLSHLMSSSVLDVLVDNNSNNFSEEKNRAYDIKITLRCIRELSIYYHG
jgi:hypothetical protein